MSELGKRVTLMEAATMTAVTPLIRFLWRGERGCGKSSGLQIMQKMLPNHIASYVDCTAKDIGDLAMPMVDVENRITYMAPAASFKMAHDSNRPVLLCLDEYSKGPRAVQNALHTLFETASPRFYDIPVPPGSVIYMTGNLTEEGLGDQLMGHTLDRVTEIEIAKPTAAEWLPWAASKGLNPAMMAFVKRFPQVLASFRDDNQGDNPYIMHPSRQQKQVFTPRGAERASHLLDQRQHYTNNSLLAALQGTIGAAAAHDLKSFIAYQDELPSMEGIINDPMNAAIPDSPGACAVLVYSAVNMVDAHSIKPFMQYLQRLAREWQSVFCFTIATDEAKRSVAYASPAVRDWMIQNVDVL